MASSELPHVPVPGFTGMNIASPPEVIGKTEVAVAVDCLFNEPGVVKRRGATAVSDLLVTLVSPYQIIKAFTTQRTDGVVFVGLVAIDPVTGFLYFISCDQNFGNYKIEQITNTTGTATPLISVKPALGGGVWVGVSNQAEATAAPSTTGRQFLWYWKGGSFVSAGYVLSATPVAIGNATVTLAAPPVPNLVGGFVFSNLGFYVGVVKSVSGAVLTLERPAMIGAGAGVTMNIRPIRAYIPHYSKGRITTSTANAVVAGAGLDFTTMDSTWEFFRSSDNAYIGQVSSVTTGTSLTLGANSLVNMSNEPYWAVKSNINETTLTPASIDTNIEIGTSLIPHPGWINTVHQGRQFFANRNKLPDAGGDYVSRVWVSDLQFGESIDFNLTDGDFLQIGSGINNTGPILELISIQNQLLVFKEAEVWTIVGDAPSNYTSKKLFSDGLLCTMGWAQWNDGVIWIGRKGLWYYDGVSTPVNLVAATMGKKWLDFVAPFSQANSDRCWLAAVKDHAMVSMSNFIQMVAPKTLNNPMPVVYVPTQALSFWTNMQHAGGFTMSGVLNARDVILNSTNPVQTNSGGLIDMANVFNGGTTVDAYLLNVGTLQRTINVAAAPGGTLPMTTIKVNGMSSGWVTGSGDIWINGDPNNKVHYTGMSQAAGVTTFTGCTGGIVGTVVTAATTVITSYPLGPFFFLTSRKEDAELPMVRKSWRQVSFQYLATGSTLNFFTSMNHDTTLAATRLNPVVAASGVSWSADRQRFGHVGFYAQWTVEQSTVAMSDVRIGSSQMFFKPQRSRRVK